MSLARRLIAGQFPQWSHLRVAAVEFDGWDNRTFRLGPELSIRLPSGDWYAEQVDQGLLLVGGQRAAAMEVVPSGRRAPGRVHAPQGVQEPGQGRREAGRSAIRAFDAGSPSSQRYTDHGYGNPEPGSPLATGIGVGSGSCGASTGSHPAPRAGRRPGAARHRRGPGRLLAGPLTRRASGAQRQWLVEVAPHEDEGDRAEDRRHSQPGGVVEQHLGLDRLSRLTYTYMSI